MLHTSKSQNILGKVIHEIQILNVDENARAMEMAWIYKGVRQFGGKKKHLSNEERQTPMFIYPNDDRYFNKEWSP